jgi:hypothetical protein
MQANSGALHSQVQPPVRATCWALLLGALLVPPMVAGPAWAAPAAAGAASFDAVVKGNNAADLARWGRRFEHGEGVERDVDHAIRLYCKAAAKGDAAAHYHLGWIYAVGRAGERDDDLAAAWFHRAAQKNDPHAKRMLERLGYEGKPRQQAVCLLSDGGRATASGGVERSQRFAGGAGRQYVSITREHPARGRVAQMVRRLAPEYRLNPNLVLAVIEAESNFNPSARSPKDAQGLMQLIPATAERFGVGNVWDPEQNIRGGMAYLRWLMGYFDGDLELVLAAYNAGEGAVERHGGIPPYAETQNYVRRILARLN